jgi:phosphoribosyl-ATP pyrophosphohydrolase
MSKELTEEIIERIEDYLADRSTGQETAAWAVSVLTQRTFSAGEKLVEDALTALAGLHDGDERFDTAGEDLIYFKNCLLARVPYTVSLEFPARATAEKQSTYEIEPRETDE